MRPVNFQPLGLIKETSIQQLKKQLFSADDLCTIQKDLDLSTRQVHTLAQDMRMASGSRQCIETGLKDKLYNKNHQLDDFFEERILSFKAEKKETKSMEKISQHVVVCNDLTSLTDKIIEEWELDSETTLIRIGMDGGQGFVKFCLSVFELNANENTEKNALAEKFKDLGVKKAMIITVVPDIPENYFNIKRLWINVGLHLFNRKFTIATDLKLCNILLGLMSHSSMHPCCWCDVDKNNLHKKGNARTVGNLSDIF